MHAKQMFALEIYTQCLFYFVQLNLNYVLMSKNKDCFKKILFNWVSMLNEIVKFNNNSSSIYK